MSSHTASLNGIELHYEIDGTGDPLLLLHGGTGCHDDWRYAGLDEFVQRFRVIRPDARGHGQSTNPARTITHRQCALDMLALLDNLQIPRCSAVGLSMGGNILLHMATMQPERISAMVVVSATMRFPDQARAIMQQIPAPLEQPAHAWEAMRQRHPQGDDQIAALWEWTSSLQNSYDDMNFTARDLSGITARTLVVYGDRDPLYPVEMGVEMYRAIPRSALWVVPGGGHGPVFLEAADMFAKTSIRFLEEQDLGREGCAK
ncbi:MAG: alpha/beta hydrolase [Acidobacteria bacterium]|nr:alpha/beta hydrolase [Acidobacteriota bacterium]